MKMKKKIIWRLANRPTPTEVIELNNSGLLTKEEAREILLSEETEDKRSEDSLKSEIKFLRELVEKLSKGSQNTIVETIRYIEKPYIKYPWHTPYQIWCSGPNGTSASAQNLIRSVNTNTQGGLGTTSFSGIQTF